MIYVLSMDDSILFGPMQQEKDKCINEINAAGLNITIELTTSPLNVMPRTFGVRRCHSDPDRHMDRCIMFVCYSDTRDG